MYPSDYGYMSDLSVCNSTLISYNNDNCKNTNWRFNASADYWTISPFSTTNPLRGTYVSKNGLVTENYVCGGKLVYPTVYLKSDVSIVAGKGTSDNPYVLG